MTRLRQAPEPGGGRTDGNRWGRGIEVVLLMSVCRKQRLGKAGDGKEILRRGWGGRPIRTVE